MQVPHANLELASMDGIVSKEILCARRWTYIGRNDDRNISEFIYGGYLFEAISAKSQKNIF